VIVIISNTGETMSAIQTANISGRMGAKVIAITSIKHSKLAHAANIVICLHPNDDENRERLAPLGTLFEDATLIFLDGIVSDLMKKMDENERIMRSRHAIWV
jgi:6-phospho-3-hexuloisomerase